MINALRITSQDERRIQRLIRRALRNAISYEQMLGRMLVFKNTGEHTPMPETHYLEFDVGYRVALQVEEFVKGMPCKHLTVRGPNELPAPQAVMFLMKMFGYHNPIEQCVVYTEELNDTRHAVHIIEPVDGDMALLKAMAKQDLATQPSPSTMVH